MDRSNRVRQWYGYTVCLIAVVTALLTLKSVLEHAVDLSNPVLGPDPYGESLVSFEAWKATRGGRFEAPDVKTTADSVPDAVLRQRFIAVRTERIAERQFRARKGLVTSGALLLVAAALFATHWRWLRNLPETGA